jgi:hypothetical protein
VETLHKASSDTTLESKGRGSSLQNGWHINPGSTWFSLIPLAREGLVSLPSLPGTSQAEGLGYLVLAWRGWKSTAKLVEVGLYFFLWCLAGAEWLLSTNVLSF